MSINLPVDCLSFARKNGKGINGLSVDLTRHQIMVDASIKNEIKRALRATKKSDNEGE